MRLPGDQPVCAGARALPLLALIIAALAIAATTARAAAAGEGARIAGVYYTSDLPTLVAEREGLFAEEGARATVSYWDSGRESLRELRAGRADFALMAVSPFVRDYLQDSSRGGLDDPVILATVAASNATHAIVSAAPPMELASARDTALRVGVPYGTGAHFLWYLWRNAYLSADLPVDVRPMEPGEIVDAYLARAIDVAALWEPLVQQLTRQDRVPALRMPASDIYTAQWLLVSTRRTVEHHPERTLAMLRAYQRAGELLKRDPALGRRLMARHWGARFGGEGMQRVNMPTIFDVTLNWLLYVNFYRQVDFFLAIGAIDGIDGGADAIAFLPALAPAPLAQLDPHEREFLEAAPDREDTEP